MNERRKNKWIDRFQTHLLFRAFMYFVVYQVTFVILMMLWQQYSNMYSILGYRQGQFSGWLPIVLICGILTGIFAYEFIRFTHRLVGPVYRFRGVMKALRRGEPVKLIELRKGDYLIDVQDDFNDFLKHLQQQGVIELTDADAPNEQSAAQAPRIAAG